MRLFPFDITPATVDERWMLEALKQAWKAFCQDEVPIGAVLVHEERVVARGHNQVEMLQDATAHAEMLCLTAGEAAFRNWRLEGATLYCTLEPCAMCLGALFLTRVHRVVFGAPDLRQGACGSWVNLLATPHPIHGLEVTNGVLAEPSSQLLRQFFQEKRNERTS